jgi:hypothetical protein
MYNEKGGKQSSLMDCQEHIEIVDITQVEE